VLPVNAKASFGLKVQSFFEALHLRVVVPTPRTVIAIGSGANAASSAIDGKLQRPLVVVENET
jgi:hypothetical protein